jgi:hypothetical protein
MRLGDHSPHPALNRHHRIGGERYATLSVEVQHRLPQPDPPRLEQVSVSLVAMYLSPQHEVNQSFVLAHQAILADPTAGLGAAKHGWPSQVM